MRKNYCIWNCFIVHIFVLVYENLWEEVSCCRKSNSIASVEKNGMYVTLGRLISSYVKIKFGDTLYPPGIYLLKFSNKETLITTMDILHLLHLLHLFASLHL